MNHVTNKPRAFTWHLFAGLIVGAILIPIVAREWDGWRDEVHRQEQISTPVIKTQVEIAGRDAASVTIHVTGEKLRACVFVGLQAFAIDKSGVMTLANIARPDNTGPRPVTRPVGRFDAGLWRIWPLDVDADSVRVYIVHNCDGVDVHSVFAQVAIRGAS